MLQNVTHHDAPKMSKVWYLMKTFGQKHRRSFTLVLGGRANLPMVLVIFKIIK